MQAMRLRDAYEGRKALYLHAAVTDPKKRRTLRPDKYLLIRPERRAMSGKDIIASLKTMPGAKL